MSFKFSSFTRLILVFIHVTIITLSSCSEDHVNIHCIANERRALAAFKDGLSDPSGRLVSWVGDDCCNWSGIRCNNVSGHVEKISLSNQFPDSEGSRLGGEINSSLLQLKFLNYLDLSQNDFSGLQIPIFFGELRNLKYLNLSFSSFSGHIPPHLGNLSGLDFLDLSMDFGMWELRAENWHWLFGMSSLKYLGLAEVKVNNTGADWLNAVNMLPLLIELHLHECDLQILPLSLPFINFTSLEVLDLSRNTFNSSMPLWLFKLTNLKRLDLSENSIIGPIPDEIGNLISLEELKLSWNRFDGRLTKSIGQLCKLKILDLSSCNFSGDTSDFFNSFSKCPNTSLVSLDISNSGLDGELPESLGRLDKLINLDLVGNSFSGSIPFSIGKLLSLQTLDVSMNKMNGTIPESLGRLSELTSLSLIANNWTGVITEAQLMNLKKLEDLVISTDTNMSFVFNVTDDWVPPFRLNYIYIQNCQVGPRFPVWLQVQSELTQVMLMNVGISDSIPENWFSKFSDKLASLTLSKNQIKGMVPHKLVFPELQTLDLSDNRFEGPLPIWYTNATRLYLQNNLFSGPIPFNIDQLIPEVQYLYFSENRLTGKIPSSICRLNNLQVLSLRINQISGELPVDWAEMQSLWVIDVANNNLSGKVPASIGFLPRLEILSLSHNDFEGEVPTSLQNCTGLVSIDLGENKFSGKFPMSLGENITNLWMLRLRSNLFDGDIPQRLCNLSVIHILDLSQNKFSGGIPKCLGNLSALVYGNTSEMYYLFSRSHRYIYVEQAVVVAKGRELQYENTLKFVNIFDFSGNNLMGSIPEQITNLSALGTLNLSMNQLTGRISDNIGNLRLLETLDLSNNHLSGPIPTSISSLNFLAHLNLSYNNLSGRIPSGNQLQTINETSIYMGNPLLCGVPLTTKCPGDDTSVEETSNDASKEDHDDDEDDSDMLWFYISLGPGFIVGFWGVCGTLLVKKSWRYAYFRFFDGAGDRAALTIALLVAFVRRRMGMAQN